MTRHYQHPRELLCELEGGAPGARAELIRLCGDDLRKCLARCKNAAYPSAVGRNLAHWVEMYLASRGRRISERLSDTAELAWKELRYLICGATIRLLLWPQPHGDCSLGARPAEKGSFQSRVYLQFDDGGSVSLAGQPMRGGFEAALFQQAKMEASGDLVQVTPTQNGLWVFVADGCGKGLAVHLLMRGVGLLWGSLPLNSFAGPADVLGAIQKAMVPHLPEGFFVEAVLGRLNRNGVVQLAAAGGARVVQRDETSSARTSTVSGCLLGDIDYPEVVYGQAEWKMRAGDEILLATDGLYDQPKGGARIGETLDQLLLECDSRQGLFDFLVSTAQGCCAEFVQEDDITLAWIKAN